MTALLRRRRRRRAGQSMVEYAITVPVFLLLLLGMMEFGFAFAHHMTMEYATREGARTGAALGAGSPPFVCSDPGNPDNEVDNQIIAAVQRVLTGAGSGVDIDEVRFIRIFDANASGQPISNRINLWVPGDGPAVDGVQLLFKKDPRQQGWPCSAANRDNSAPAAVGSYPDSIGVSLEYYYQFVTPLASLMRITGSAELQMTDRTVMALNPTPQ